MITALALAALLGASNTPVRAFAAAPMYLPRSAEITVDHQTVRMPLRVTLGGHDLRVTLSNAHGRDPATIARASLIVGGKIYPLTFAGRETVEIPVGGPVLSDPVPVHVAAEEVVELSLYIDRPTILAAIHRDPKNPATVSTAGDFTATADIPAASTTVMRPYLAAVDVIPDKPARTIVALGDSISDWDCGYDEAQPCMWEAELARRLAKAGKSYAIANAAISADRILVDGPNGAAPWNAVSALARFDRDVLSVPNAAYVVMMMGVNDIGLSGQNGAPVVSSDAMIAGLKQLILRAHEHGLKIYAAPILPFTGAGYYTPEKEAVRVAVNDWIRTSGAFDGVIDFSGAVADPADPVRLAAKFDNGDHLHPNAAGQRAMGDVIDLSLFK